MWRSSATFRLSPIQHRRKSDGICPPNVLTNSISTQQKQLSVFSTLLMINYSPEYGVWFNEVFFACREAAVSVSVPFVSLQAAVLRAYKLELCIKNIFLEARKSNYVQACQ